MTIWRYLLFQQKTGENRHVSPISYLTTSWTLPSHTRPTIPRRTISPPKDAIRHHLTVCDHHSINNFRIPSTKSNPSRPFLMPDTQQSSNHSNHLRKQRRHIPSIVIFFIFSRHTSPQPTHDNRIYQPTTTTTHRSPVRERILNGNTRNAPRRNPTNPRTPFYI